MHWADIYKKCLKHKKVFILNFEETAVNTGKRRKPVNAVIKMIGLPTEYFMNSKTL